MDTCMTPEYGPGNYGCKSRHPQNFKIAIDARGSPPASPMTAKSVLVQVPTDADPGAPITISHPETNKSFNVTPPTSVAAGSLFWCQV